MDNDNDNHSRFDKHQSKKNRDKISMVITLQTKIVEQNKKIQINKGDSRVFRS